MQNSLSKTRKQQGFLDEHDRLANLFVTDRFAFELERKRVLDEVIAGMYNCEKRRAEQKELDRILNRMGSSENRFAMIQALFWHHMINNWLPMLEEKSAQLNTMAKDIRSKPVLSLLKE